MPNLIFKIIKQLQLRDPEKTTRFIEQFYIRKYGSAEKVQQVFADLKAKSKDQESYRQAVHDKFVTDFHYKALKAMLKPFLKTKNIFHLAKHLKTFKASKDAKHIAQKIKTIESDYKTLMQPSFQEAFKLNENTKRDTMAFINDNVSFNLANTRKELHYSHPKVFNTWLHFFFNGKYDYKTQDNNSFNSGKLTLFEYVDIVSAFILSYDEDTLDLSNPDELLHRFKRLEGTQKQVLVALTKNNFDELKRLLTDLHTSELYKATYGNRPYDIKKRKIPYSVVTVIEAYINNENANLLKWKS